jgi:ABC-type antimicrobial peptide transport system permease subunit
MSQPGVANAAVSNLTPLAGRRFGVRFQVPGQTGDANGNGYFVSPGWFGTYRMPLLAGRDFGSADRPGAPRAIIVNQAFARGFLGGKNPVGVGIDYVDRKRRVRYQIVGLVADSAYNSIRELGSTPPTFYLPLAQYDLTTFPGPGEMTITVKPEREITHALLAAILDVNPGLSVSVRSLSEQVAVSISQERLLALLAGFFGILAILLAAIGLYGVTSYAVNLRRIEMGIRIALGGNPQRIIWMVLQRVSLLVLAGITLGLALSWWAAQFIAPSVLYGVQARDPHTLAATVIVLLTVGCVAALAPARRAASVDPLVALRYE